MSKAKRKVRGVIYSRFSDGPHQTERSIEGQVNDCSKYAEANGIDVIKIYADMAISGKESENRAQFQAMLKDAELGEFECVIVWKVDRFGRNREEIALNKLKLKKCGIKLHYATVDIPDGPEGIILESVLEGLAEYYSADLAQKIKRGYRVSASKGEFFGVAPYGYDRVDKKLQVNQEQAAIVRRVFDLYRSGNSGADITRLLEGEGVRKPDGKAIRNNFIMKMLRNRIYIGEKEYEGIKIPVDAIVDENVFNQVQEKLGMNKKKSGPFNAEQYALSSKAYCGYCESLLNGVAGTSKTGRIYHYYACGKKRKGSGCELKHVKQEWLDDFVVSHTMNDILSSELIERLVDALIDIQANDDTAIVVKSLEKEVKAIEKKIDNLYAAVENGLTLNATLQGRIDNLEKQKTDLENRIAIEKISTPRLSREQLLFWLEQFRNGDVDDAIFRKRLISTFIHEVYVWNDRISVVYNFSDGDRRHFSTEEIKCSPSSPEVDLRGAQANSQSPHVYITTYGVFVATFLYENTCTGAI